MPTISPATAYERTRVEVLDCSKTYADGTRALQATNLRVEPGEVLALLGPSGCGKTTLLRLIAGLVPPDAGGRLKFNGEDVSRRPIEQRGIGMVFQHYALFPQMSVQANIGYGLRIRGVPEAEQRQRVGELIDLVRLNGLEQRHPAELSGGQRQRVALARAVAVRPRVLLLDEPLTALDAKLKESLRDELAELLRRLHITAIHVTHDQQEAMAIADRLAVMQGGRIVQLGTAEALYRQPAQPFVAEFLGRVNRLARSAEELRDGTLQLGALRLHCPALTACATVLLRPEDIQLGADEDGQGRGLLVTRRVFLGDRIQLHLALPGQSAPLVCDAPKDSPFQTGDRVQPQVRAEDLMPA
ncbi:MAG: ABC transporter ATP-binding protein [Burkholderiaceae bacterium]